MKKVFKLYGRISAADPLVFHSHHPDYAIAQRVGIVTFKRGHFYIEAPPTYEFRLAQKSINRKKLLLQSL
jgi:hypothetical protein